MREIDLRYFQEFKPAKKEEKDSKKTKSINIPHADIFSSNYP